MTITYTSEPGSVPASGATGPHSNPWSPSQFSGADDSPPVAGGPGSGPETPGSQPISGGSGAGAVDLASGSSSSSSSPIGTFLKGLFGFSFFGSGTGQDQAIADLNAGASGIAGAAAGGIENWLVRGLLVAVGLVVLAYGLWHLTNAAKGALT